ncbi:UPF0149 family protein [Methylocystis parvus]|nr:UPF0149 family protein [Methylocystis parvus]WBJ98836.1 UPF0149 family protein [Methylocystis parvus OBBP]WBK01284.1 UPF0149 family protein [Methylocystis parvus OBBP]WBK02326.1 UPF0149 family protein [Methylocystis parvus OBBP]WBK02437.1 UPF0149 family protein [Methylocystis parvus OBBP]
MRKPPRHLGQLKSALLDMGEEAMLLEELDGLVAGVLVCPEMIPPSEWLPVVWGQTDEEAAPAFDSMAHLNEVLALVMAHYNDLAKRLFERPGTYAPYFAIDDRNGDVLWELWIEGFEKAVKLRPAAWRPLLDADLDTAKAMSGLLTLADIARGDARFSKLEHDALASTATELIGPFVLALNKWRLESHDLGDMTPVSSPLTSTSFGKVGRNDPCPCGSGKKYKKCCGLN